MNVVHVYDYYHVIWPLMKLISDKLNKMCIIRKKAI